MKTTPNIQECGIILDQNISGYLKNVPSTCDARELYSPSLPPLQYQVDSIFAQYPNIYGGVGGDQNIESHQLVSENLLLFPLLHYKRIQSFITVLF